MGSLLFLIAVIAYFKWQSDKTKKRIDNYPLWKVDSVKMAMDINASPKQKQINMINGKYDVTPYEKLTKDQKDLYDVLEREGLNPNSDFGRRTR